MSHSNEQIQGSLERASTFLLGRSPRNIEEIRTSMANFLGALSELSGPFFVQPPQVTSDFTSFVWPRHSSVARTNSTTTTRPPFLRFRSSRDDENDDDDDDDEDEDDEEEDDDDDEEDDDNDDEEDDDEEDAERQRSLPPPFSPRPREPNRQTPSASASPAAAAAASRSPLSRMRSFSSIPPPPPSTSARSSRPQPSLTPAWSTPAAPTNALVAGNDPPPVRGNLSRKMFNALRIEYARRHPGDLKAQNLAAEARLYSARTEERNDKKKEKKAKMKMARGDTNLRVRANILADNESRVAAERLAEEQRRSLASE